MINATQQGELKAFLLEFDGRINRAKYWLGVVGVGVIYTVLAIIIGVITSIIGSVIIMYILFIPLVIAMLWASIALGAKRFHDLDKSAWFLLIGLIPFVGGLVLLVWLGFIPGTEGSNQYGEDPVSTKILGIC